MQAQFKHSFKVDERPLTSLAVYNTGQQRCESGHSWGPGVRDHYLIHYVSAGRGVYTREGVTHAVTQGDMFLAWPGEMIAYSADADDPWTYCWVGFGGTEARALLRQTDFTREAPVLRAADDQPARLLMDIYDSRGARPFEVVRMTGKLYSFLAWLMQTAKAEPGQRREAGLEHVQRACDYIAGNYASQITITSIAASVGVCRSLLNRAFAQHMGISPMQYLTRYRMEQACVLLRRSDLAVKAVAYSVGYEDPLYFSRRFREIMHVSPREYARRMGDSVPPTEPPYGEGSA